jgi:uncharacterized protein (DUF924 family)
LTGSSVERVRRTSSVAAEIVNFWFVESGRRQWFAGGPAFDAVIRRRFSAHHAAAASGLLEAWRTTPNGALALILLLDQFSRNLFRRDARAYAADAYCRRIAETAIARRFDMVAPRAARPFFYLPFMHSERLEDQEKSAALFTARLPASDNLRYALHHRAIIRRFGRFPHRNAVLGRVSTSAERAYLRQGGFRG